MAHPWMRQVADAARRAGWHTSGMAAAPTPSRSTGEPPVGGAVEQLARDLKSPLTALTLRAQLLRYRAERGELDSAGMARGLAGVEEAAAGMAVLVEALLDLAHLESGAPLELQSVLVDLVALVRGAAASRPATFESDVPRLLVDCDGARLTRALASLLGMVPGARLHLRRAGASAVLEIRADGAVLPDPPTAVRRLVEAHGGSLSADPTRSALVLRLPR